MSLLISLGQLADHNSRESLWIAVHGHVYDLTTFCSDHPGGIDALESCAGMDGTELYDYASHSESNMERMQQYRVGKLAESAETEAQILHDSILVNTKSVGSVTSGSKQLQLSSWTKLVITIFAAYLAVTIFYHPRDSLAGDILPKLDMSHLRLGITPDQNIGYAFWAGILVASSVNCLGLVYLYKLFLSTLDYRNEVFSFPATIPRKTKR